MKLHTYLNYGGNCAEAFRFYEQHLGGKITMTLTHGQQPDSGNVAFRPRAFSPCAALISR